MRFVQIFRSGNTHRITLPRSVMQALRALPADTLCLNHERDGVVVITNKSDEQRAKAKRKSR